MFIQKEPFFNRLLGQTVRIAFTEQDNLFFFNARLDAVGILTSGTSPTTPDLAFSTAAFLQAGLDGSTTVEPRSVLVANAPSITEQLTKIVQFRVDSGLTHSPTQLIANLVDSALASGIVSQEQTSGIVHAVTQIVFNKFDLNKDGCVDRADLSILMAKIQAHSTDLTYDLNGDGKVTIADARFLVLHFSQPGGVPCH